MEDILDGIEYLLRVYSAMLNVIEAVLVCQLAKEDGNSLSRVLRGEWQVGKIDETAVALSTQIDMVCNREVSSKHLFL